MLASARPGIPQRVVWLAMFQAMVNASGERPWRLSIRGDGSGNSALNRPLEEMLKAGQVMSQECTGAVLGYGTQVQPFLCDRLAGAGRLGGKRQRRAWTRSAIW